MQISFQIYIWFFTPQKKVKLTICRTSYNEGVYVILIWMLNPKLNLNRITKNGYKEFTPEK